MSLSSHIGITCGEISCILKGLRYRSHHRYHCASEIGNYGNGSKYKQAGCRKKRPKQTDNKNKLCEQFRAKRHRSHRGLVKLEPRKVLMNQKISKKGAENLTKTNKETTK